MRIDDFLSKISFETSTWDDFGFRQTANITFKEESGDKNFLVKICPNTNENFERIKANQVATEEKKFFWGQTQEYYEFILDYLNDEDDRNRWFKLTGDIANQGQGFVKYYKTMKFKYDPELLESKENDRVRAELKMFEDSFFRDQTFNEWTDLLKSLHRLTVNKSFLSDYKFTVKKNSQDILNVDVKPGDNISIKLDNVSLPLSFSNNVFCIIGDNGSGKTSFIRELSKSILDISSELVIENIEFDTQEDANIMNKILYCSFSPFDEKFDIAYETDSNDEKKFEYIGLLNYDIGNKTIGEEITKDIMECLESVKNNQNNKYLLWLEAMERISFEKWSNEIVSIFENDLVRSDSEKTKEGVTTSRYIYKNYDVTIEKIKKLSSGQKIFLLTITKLVLKLTERTILFIDEPELFLHPPMVKTYVRLISDLVSYVNGLGFIITHSPITLQEFPNDCVKVAYRDILGEYLIKSVNFKTFGENINVINDMVFNIGLQQSGYYNLIERLKYSEDGEKKLKKILDFSGSEAKLLIKLFLEKNEKE